MDMTHLGTLFVLDSNRDGKVDLEELIRFAKRECPLLAQIRLTEYVVDEMMQFFRALYLQIFRRKDGIYDTWVPFLHTRLCMK